MNSAGSQSQCRSQRVELWSPEPEPAPEHLSFISRLQFLTIYHCKRFETRPKLDQQLLANRWWSATWICNFICTFFLAEVELHKSGFTVVWVSGFFTLIYYTLIVYSICFLWCKTCGNILTLHSDSLIQVWSILPALELLSLDWSRRMTSRGGTTPMQAKWIKLDLVIHQVV